MKAAPNSDVEETYIWNSPVPPKNRPLTIVYRLLSMTAVPIGHDIGFCSMIGELRRARDRIGCWSLQAESLPDSSRWQVSRRQTPPPVPGDTYHRDPEGVVLFPDACIRPLQGRMDRWASGIRGRRCACPRLLSFSLPGCTGAQH